MDVKKDGNRALVLFRWRFIIVFIGFTQCLFGQTFRDDKLELLFLKHQYLQAEELVEAMLADKAMNLDATQKTYYYTKASDIFIRRGEFEQAGKMSQKAISEATQIQDSVLYYQAWIAHAVVLNFRGKFEEEHAFLLPAFHFASRRNLPELLRMCYYQFGVLASQNNQLDKSLQWYKEALKISSQPPFRHSMQRDEANIALVYLAQFKLDSAKTRMDRALEHAVQENDSTVLALCYNIKAMYHQLLGDKLAWRDNLKKSLVIGEQLRHKTIISVGYSQLMQDAIAEKRFRDAVSLGNQTRKLMEQTQFVPFVYFADSLLYESYLGLGRLDSAIYYLKTFYTEKGKAVSLEQSDKLNELMASFAMKEKNLLIENQQLELANTQKRTWMLVTGNVLLGMLLLGSFTYRRMRRKQQSRLYRKEKLTEYLLEQEKGLARIQQEQNGVVASVSIPEGDPLSDENQAIEILPEDKKDLYLQMISAIETQRLYLNPNLDMNLVVTMLGTNKLYLYKAITSNAPVNFRNIINRYRVEEAKRIIEKEVRENTFFNIENVYSASGFNSTSSFYRIFRLYTGLTPNEYKQEYALELREQESSTTD